MNQILNISILSKDYKLAIAEVRVLSKMAVFSRLKQDYATLSSRGGKVTSSYDSRISFTVPRNGIDGRDHVIMEVRSCDSCQSGSSRYEYPETMMRKETERLAVILELRKWLI